MKFGNYLAESEHPGWEEHYIAYEHLKEQLLADPFGPTNETLFNDSLEAEIEKVHRWKREKWTELQQRTAVCRKNLNKALADPSAESVLLEDFEGEIYDIAAQVKQLYAFLRINNTAVLKILKKHDKRSGYSLRSVFLARIQNKGYNKDDFDPLLYSLSELWDEFRTRGSREKVEAPSGGGNFVRKTRKYWVHEDNVTAVKLHIMEHLPVLLFKGDTEPDPAITSIYFDNDTFDLYHARMEKQEGAEALRMRFYGKTTNPQIFVERKTHHEALSGLESVKERFPIQEKNMNAFLRGEYDTAEIFAKMRAAGKVSEEEIVSQEKLAQEVRTSVLGRRLRPAVRTFYNRTAFQLPGDSRVRMSLDTQLTMVREDNGGGVTRSGDNWRRNDVGTVFPFDYLTSGDVIEFPYAVLEVKLQSHNGVETPSWVKALINGHLVEAPPKFSKFGHGIATFFPDQVNILPMWLSLVDIDIRKPAPQRSSEEQQLARGRKRLSNASGQFSTPLPDWDPSLSQKRSTSRSSSQSSLRQSASTGDLWLGNPPPAAPPVSKSEHPTEMHAAEIAAVAGAVGLTVAEAHHLHQENEEQRRTLHNSRSDETLLEADDPRDASHQNLHVGSDGQERHVAISMDGLDESKEEWNRTPRPQRSGIFSNTFRVSRSSSAFNPFRRKASAGNLTVATDDSDLPRHHQEMSQVGSNGDLAITDVPAYSSVEHPASVGPQRRGLTQRFRRFFHGNQPIQEPNEDYPPFDLEEMEQGHYVGGEPVYEEVHRPNSLDEVYDEDDENNGKGGKKGKKGKKGGKKGRKAAAAAAAAALLMTPYGPGQDGAADDDEARNVDMESSAPVEVKPKKVRRIDPKLYIQNERTFIQWCKLGVITGALAAAMFNFVSPTNPRLRQYGTSMTFAAAAIVVYAFGLYVWRLRRINMRMDGVAFSWGPLFVSIILVALLVMSAILQLTLGSTYHS
ncbi:vacuolar transporter chaperone [Thoreauomyces humboldtii]|nr:vacuolar transporter chaperone [Thoreauomyces humboldtii]